MFTLSEAQSVFANNANEELLEIVDTIEKADLGFWTRAHDDDSVFAFVTNKRETLVVVHTAYDDFEEDSTLLQQVFFSITA